MKTNHFLSLAAIFALTFTLSCIIGCPQKASKEDTTYTEIVNVSGVSKDDLYEKASLWFSDAFQGPDVSNFEGLNVSKKSAIITSDRGKGTIKANYTFLTDAGAMGTVFQVWFVYSTVELQASDGQYRLTFSNPENSAASHSDRWIYSSSAPLFSKYVLATKNAWQSLASSLRETVGGTSAGN